jgi:hypothetical protein
MPMDMREFSQRIKALQSSIAKNDPASEITTQLEHIKKDAAPTEDMLRVSFAPPPLHVPSLWHGYPFALPSAVGSTGWRRPQNLLSSY